MSESEPILLKKFQLLEVVSVNRNLKGCDFAVFWQIQDHYNQKLGYAFPSFNRLALRTGFSKRNIQNSVSRLVEQGVIQIILHGSRNNVANRYKPNYELLSDWLEWRENYPNAELGVWKHSSIGNNAGVWNASSEGMEAQFQSYGSTVPSNPSINPSINEGLIVGLSANATSDAALASPLAGLPLTSKEKYKYPEFWNVYPTRKNVGKTEGEITIKLTDGVLLADIVEGARLYAINVQSKRASWKGDKDYTIHPQNFVKDSRWLDDWAVAPKSKEVKPKVKPIDDLQYKEAYEEAFNAFYNHTDSAYLDSIGRGSVDSCKGSCQEYNAIDYEEYPNKFLFDFCAVGKPLYYEYMRLKILYRGLDSTGGATMEELIKAYHLMRKRGSDWRAANPDDDSLVGCGGDKEWLKLCDAKEEMELNAYHLFK